MSEALISLAELKVGSTLSITKIEVAGTLRRRLLDLGFVPGAEIEVLQKSPLGDPVAYRVSNTTIALRREESSKIWGREVRGL